MLWSTCSFMELNELHFFCVIFLFLFCFHKSTVLVDEVLYDISSKTRYGQILTTDENHD